MKGLFKSNFLAVWTNAKIFLLFMFAMGIAVIIIPDQTWQMYFIIIGIGGLAVNAATVIGNEFSSKWGKYCNLLEYLTQRDIQTKNSGVNVRYRGKHRFFKGFNEFIKEKTRRCDNDFEKIERHVFF